MSNGARQGNRLRTVGTLSDTHLGRTITLRQPGGDLTGKLAGLIPVGNTVQAVLIVGGVRLWTDRLPLSTHVEVWQKGAGQ